MGTLWLTSGGTRDGCKAPETRKCAEGAEFVEGCRMGFVTFLASSRHFPSLCKSNVKFHLNWYIYKAYILFPNSKAQDQNTMVWRLLHVFKSDSLRVWCPYKCLKLHTRCVERRRSTVIGKPEKLTFKPLKIVIICDFCAFQSTFCRFSRWVSNFEGLEIF